MENELCHYGIHGMRWGVRRYQNKDGTLTNAGKKRSKSNEQSKPEHEDYTRAHDKKSIKSMSDVELRNRNNRLLAEKQYNNLTEKTGRGKKLVNTLISVAGTITAAEAAYKTYKRTGKNITDKVIRKIGNYITKDLNAGLSKRWY